MADRQRCKARNTAPNVPSHTTPRKVIPKSASIQGHKIQEVDLEKPAAEPESRYPKASGNLGWNDTRKNAIPAQNMTIAA
ncbi:hypothetical protein BPAE_0002g01040 [Botrytis paeoniae]|uniref:Uncharacterized protein n=1 Tax=Botrytis paeoniae TaxID=278948 RepID=A0A4Z1GA48_9HELO|nr:hypothetical protein BPAE_0002g01040 [Botrytis paeoniae]